MSIFQTGNCTGCGGEGVKSEAYCTRWKKTVMVVSLRPDVRHHSRLTGQSSCVSQESGWHCHVLGRDAAGPVCQQPSVR